MLTQEISKKYFLLHFSNYWLYYKRKFQKYLLKIRFLLNRSKKSNLKKTTLAILKILGDNSGDIHLDHSFSFILDAIDTELYSSKSATLSKKSIPKYVLPITSENKALELIKILQILNPPGVIKTLPSSLRNRDNIPTVTYNLGATVRK